jgi:hypothetical protein
MRGGNEMKTNELSGAQLDWAVAKAEGYPDEDISVDWNYSTNWAQGGPIIEREKINVRFITPNASTSPCWAYISMESDDFNVEGWGHTPLIAAMRCYVASKLGDEVECKEEEDDDRC